MGKTGGKKKINPTISRVISWFFELTRFNLCVAILITLFWLFFNFLLKDFYIEAGFWL
jgi:hypothetical protein